MNKNHRQMTVRNGLRRGFTALLCLVMLLGLVPGLELPVQAADSWATPYLNQLVNWGVMRGDINGNLYPERNITRAEFVTMMNRAYGYDTTGGNPFADVFTSDWYYDDIDIAYNVGYFTGTSANTASPQAELTREQAAVLLARNMMLQGTSGEVLGFSDSRDLSEWSRGLVGAVADAGVISGYGDGSFRPKNSITRGEVAAMLSRAVGSLISQPGDESLGSVYGNLTINSSGVSLRNTTVVGNLYLTGGIGLGDVLLENVDVYGEIIVAGAGEANSSKSSVVMRNVTANELIVDNISNQFVTVRAEGDTRIGKTSVRTNAYVEDTTPNGYGLTLIELDGEPGTKLQLAGNIKEVRNLTPQSSLEISQGTAAKVTSDEHATGSAVRVEAGARVDELNLDVGASVSGDGDIGSMNVGAAGTNVGILPDNITVRPGITSNITGTTMNNVTAAESSADPRLLSGYPAVRNVAPNSATLVFSTNKAGTVYWAVSALADGSVSEDDLITNPAYGGNILRSGRINAASSKTEYTAQVSGLTIDGSYYVSAILVDSRGNHSPLKVTAFSTPDNTTPAFTSGYPVITRNTTKTAQVTVMTNKSCQMYYALLPRGSSTPTANELKSGAVSGNLGYGVVDVVKNNTQPVNVNSIQLEELTNYTLYLWLNDYDNAHSSGVRSVSFTTPDETPPVVTDIRQTESKADRVTVSFTLNEPGRLYWAVVTEGNTDFMGFELNTTEAKVTVESGAFRAISGNNARATKADTAVSFTISGLNKAAYGTSYDVYYIAKDNAGNYAASVGKINVRTADNEAPKVTQEFTNFNEGEKDKPLADTDIRLVFDERVQGGTDGKGNFLSLYEDVKNAVDKEGPSSDAAKDAREALGDALHKFIKMYPDPTANNKEVTVRDKDNEEEKDLIWTIDYRFATVGMEDGSMVITFPTVAESGQPASALSLDSGATYYFHVEGIYDTALKPNAMGAQDLPKFQTVFARVKVDMGQSGTIDEVWNDDSWSADDNVDNPDSRIDFNFVVDPISVDHADRNKFRDMLIWSNIGLKYSIYSRELDANGDPVRTDKAWEKLNDKSIEISTGGIAATRFSSLARDVLNPDADPTPLEKLNDPDWKKTEYAIHIDSIGDNAKYKEWNYNNVTINISVVAGDYYPMLTLMGGNDQTTYDNAISEGVVAIGDPDPRRLNRTYSDRLPPDITDLTVGYNGIRDTSAQFNLMLNREGTVYYVAAPILTLNGVNSNSPLSQNSLEGVSSFLPSVTVAGGTLPGDTTSLGASDQPKLSKIPVAGKDKDEYNPVSPTHTDIRDKTFPTGVIKANTGRRGANVAISIDLNKLNPNTVYLLFLTTEGVSGASNDKVYCYRFTTLEPIRPVITLQPATNSMDVSSDKRTTISYVLANNNDEGGQFRQTFESQTNSPDTFVAGFKKDILGGGTSYRYTDNANGNTFTITKNLSKITVIDAMMARCYDGNNNPLGSVFDVYAAQTSKNNYADLIRGNYNEGGKIVDRNAVTCERSTGSSQGYYANAPLRNMRVGNMYTFICVGRSVGDTGDSFAAYYTVTMTDETPPKVTGIDYSDIMNVDKDHAFMAKDSVITVYFSEPLWVRTNETTMGQNRQKLDLCESHTSSYFALGSLNMSLNGCTPVYDSKKDGADVYSISFKVNKDCQYISVSIQNVLCDEWNVANVNGKNTINFQFSARVSNDGEMRISNLPSVWKGENYMSEIPTN
ncbi:MAG: S-layer homology domain-containing protein [Butyricicoccus sp.]|nr:S-layer homology domain-containing protein [Butyricicoccus sp.]